MVDTQQAHESEPAGQMGAWAPYYDLLMKIITLGRENALREATVDLAPVKAGDHVLEVGCGTGTLTLKAQERAGRSGDVHGIDVAPEMIEVARRKNARARKDVTFQEGHIDQIPFPDGKFDVALCSFMIFHMDEDTRQRGIEELFRVLKEGGRLLIVDLLSQDNLSALERAMGGAGFTEITKGERKLGILSPSVSFIRGTAHKV
jgi:ubiquinone/menaquinone biosynthesis C-methylase UbiE